MDRYVLHAIQCHHCRALSTSSMLIFKERNNDISKHWGYCQAEGSHVINIYRPKRFYLRRMYELTSSSHEPWMAENDCNDFKTAHGAVRAHIPCQRRNYGNSSMHVKDPRPSIICTIPHHQQISLELIVKVARGSTPPSRKKDEFGHCYSGHDVRHQQVYSTRSFVLTEYQ